MVLIKALYHFLQLPFFYRIGFTKKFMNFLLFFYF